MGPNKVEGKKENLYINSCLFFQSDILTGTILKSTSDIYSGTEGVLNLNECITLDRE